MCTSRVRITYLGGNVLTYDQRHTSVATDFTHGLGRDPERDLRQPARRRLPRLFAERVHADRQRPVQLRRGHTAPERGRTTRPAACSTRSSVRNIYSPEVTVAKELMVDQVAKAMGHGPVSVPPLVRARLPDARRAGRGGQGRQLGQADGAAHRSGHRYPHEYKGYAACVAEIDCTPQTVNRTVENGYTGPRVTKVDLRRRRRPADQPARPRGPDDRRNHGRDRAGADVQPAPPGRLVPRGELGQRLLHAGVERPPPFALEGIVIHAARLRRAGRGGRVRGRAVDGRGRKRVRAGDREDCRPSFPINHNQPLGFTPLPTVPPIPQSPTDGLLASEEPF